MGDLFFANHSGGTSRKILVLAVAYQKFYYTLFDTFYYICRTRHLCQCARQSLRLSGAFLCRFYSNPVDGVYELVHTSMGRLCAARAPPPKSET